ncbi:MAG: hypothetical protein AB3N19_16565 [Ruegeria sp.]
MTDTLPTVASFWYGSDLSWLEELCIQSFLDRGHRFVLYTAHPVNRVPSAVVVRSASEILWPAPFDLKGNNRQRVAVFSDLFRLHMCQQTDFIWVDLDAYCVQPFDFTEPHVFGREVSGMYPNGVLRLPANSPTLERYLDFVTSPNPTQPWRGRRLHRANETRIANGQQWGIESLPWGCSGPKALGYFLEQTGEDTFAQPPHAFFPLPPEELGKLHDPAVASSDIEQNGVHSVHVYGHQKKWLANTLSGLPVRGSYLHRLCQRHAIDPHLNPIKQLSWMVPD